jgi:hypothetical protein
MELKTLQIIAGERAESQKTRQRTLQLGRDFLHEQ